MDAMNLILFAVLFVLQVAILILLLRRRSGDAGHQTVGSGSADSAGG